MMNLNIEQRVKKVMSNLFAMDLEQITHDTSQDTIAGWNSLGHMNLIIALEEEFNIVFSDEQIIEMLSYSLVIIILSEILTEKAMS